MWLISLLTLIILVLVLVSFILGFQETEQTSTMSYECGFMPFEEARIYFNVQFYVISILFVLFDLEIVLLFPFMLTISFVGLFGYFVVMFFIVLLTIAFAYEWYSGSFNFVHLKNSYRESN